MPYFSIQNSHNKKIIGKYPQTKDINYNCHVWDDPKFVGHINFEKVDFEPITANAILDPKAKQTDLVNANGAMGFSNKLLVSSKLKTILEKNRLSGMQFFKAPIIQNNITVNDYWILNMYEFNHEYIDVSKSMAYCHKQTEDYNISFKTEKILLEINNLNDFMKYFEIAKPKLEMVNFEKIHFLNLVKENFFALKYVFGAMYFVSEKIKKEIEVAGCTGIEFQPTELSLNEWTMPGGERERLYGKL